MAGLIEAGTYRLVSQDGLTEKDITIDNNGNPLFDSIQLAKQSDIGTANSSLVKTALNAGGSAPIYACRAWVVFNGVGTVSVISSGNVSSITDNGTGNYTINFSSALPDTGYSISTMSTDDGVMGGFFYEPGTGGAYRSTTSCRILWTGHTGATGDRSVCSFALFR